MLVQTNLENDIMPRHMLTFDFETYSLRPNAKVLSLGAVVFTPNSIVERVYLEFDLAAQSDRHEDPKTVEWWQSQGNPPISGDSPLLYGIKEVNALYKGWDCTEVWVNGSDFDIPIFYDIARKKSISPAWKYNQVRDVRTISKLFNIKGSLGATAHQALQDAEWNVSVVQELYDRFPEAFQ
jgi:hypothetical protein